MNIFLFVWKLQKNLLAVESQKRYNYLTLISATMWPPKVFVKINYLKQKTNKMILSDSFQYYATFHVGYCQMCFPPFALRQNLMCKYTEMPNPIPLLCHEHHQLSNPNGFNVKVHFLHPSSVSNHRLTSVWHVLSMDVKRDNFYLFNYFNVTRHPPKRLGGVF